MDSSSVAPMSTDNGHIEVHTNKELSISSTARQIKASKGGWNAAIFVIRKHVSSNLESS